MSPRWFDISDTGTVMRSVRLYHGNPAQKARMDALYARYLKDGDLAFDIGSHVGDRVSSFRRLGARVIAVEPQPGPARAIRLIHGRDRDVRLVTSAVGPARGQVTLKINRKNPTVSTASGAFIAAADGAEGWEGQDWDASLDVPMTTLDAMIAEFGRPAFVKIDVEGFEADVLAGLTQAVPALSFEFTTIAREVAGACLIRLDALAPYRYNVALGETQRLMFDTPLTGADMADFIDQLPHAANSGDVYATLA